MSEKNGKALALELIDDLLNEKTLAEPHVNPEPPAPKHVEPESAANEAASDLPSPDEPFENDKTIALSDDDAPVNYTPQLNIESDLTVPLADLERGLTTSNQPAVPNAYDTQRPRTSVGRHQMFRQSGGGGSVTDAALAQSESLRIAQGRILELEQELERLRLQNEELGAAGETLRRRADELSTQNSRREGDYQNALSLFEQEKEILRTAKDALGHDLDQQKQKTEELELRISTNIQKIRVRERELENRLELVKMESAALIRSKDEIILELKRQIDQLNIELTNFRNKNQELNRVTIDKQEMLRRTVKALRLALSMLEGEEEAPRNASARKAK